MSNVLNFRRKRRPWLVFYETETTRGRMIRVEAYYDDGTPDDFGPVVPNARIRKVFDAATGRELSPPMFDADEWRDVWDRVLDDARNAAEGK